MLERQSKNNMNIVTNITDGLPNANSMKILTENISFQINPNNYKYKRILNATLLHPEVMYYICFLIHNNIQKVEHNINEFYIRKFENTLTVENNAENDYPKRIWLINYDSPLYGEGYGWALRYSISTIDKDTSKTITYEINNNNEKIRYYLNRNESLNHRLDGPALIEKVCYYNSDNIKYTLKTWFINGIYIDRNIFPVFENGKQVNDVKIDNEMKIKLLMFDREYFNYVMTIIK